MEDGGLRVLSRTYESCDGLTVAQLALGEDDALLSHLGLQVVALRHRTDAAGEDDDPLLTQSISGA